ncbi:MULTISPECIES: restriction endonuclease subunit S [Aeromonas]|uniref:restriction endonuclease subunit S n=1 Tax=Aeromonas TaxID=642 RepID=UPI000CDCEA56|nr:MULTISPECIES: restriction endonuclease subunit S [Aeromonas]AUZ77354.1 restriction endonuclease subunit S [Aeromonas sp. ASNIH4]MBP8277360.1 restriction endonuclease subunit S [Propionivibrio sp.]POU37949.1 restriction endonuclease subunit S [Aeromonas hydrophila]POV85219.1 restriction endonuclease subunit S [Aeromonas sp. ASNIH6]
MVSEWRTALLGDLTVNHDGKRKPVKESDRRPGPYPYYGASGIVDYVDGYLFDGDYLLIAEDGENLRTRQTPIAFMARGKSWVNNHAHIVTGNDKADTRFLMYAIAGTDISGYLTGAVMPKLTQGNLNKIELNCPPICEQRAIAHILGTLDDKIELNRRANETLEAMARTLFKAWFVDFEPVRAKIEGRWQRGQSLPGMPAHLYDLFPDRLVESELGEIPEGWEMRSLDSIANYLNGLALQKFPPEGDDEFLPVIKIAQLRAGNTNGADRASARIKPEYVVVDGDVLFSWSGSLEVEVWNGGRGALNQHLFKVTSNTVPKWFYFFATRHHLQSFRAIAADKATTMGHIQRKHLTDARVAVASPEGMKKFDIAIAPLFDQLVSNAQQSRSLAQLRDTLLPKLISGELRVGDADKYLRGIA